MGKLVHELAFQLTKLEHRVVPESEFTLAAYGFNEPFSQTSTQRRYAWWLWAAIGGGALLLLAAAFAWLRQRRR